MIEHTRIPFADLVFLDDNPRTRTPEGLQRMADDIRADPTFFENRHSQPPTNSTAAATASK